MGKGEVYRKAFCPKENDHEIIKDETQPDGSQQHISHVHIRQGSKTRSRKESKESIQKHTDNECNRKGHIQTQHHAPVPDDPKVSPHHINTAVRKIDQTHRTISHRGAQSNQRI